MTGAEAVEEMHKVDCRPIWRNWCWVKVQGKEGVEPRLVMEPSCRFCNHHLHQKVSGGGQEGVEPRLVMMLSCNRRR